MRGLSLPEPKYFLSQLTSGQLIFIPNTVLLALWIYLLCINIGYLM